MKKILVILFSLLILTGCGKEEVKNKDNTEFNKRRESYISGIGATNDSRVVVNFKNGKEEDCYYVFYITGSTYTQKQYTLHNGKNSYSTFVDSHITATNYELVRDPELLTTEIILKKNQSVDGNVKEFILNKYKDKKFTIIYEED